MPSFKTIFHLPEERSEPPSVSAPFQSAVPFTKVEDAERDALNAYRKKHIVAGRYPAAESVAGDCVGLAFSGGGIRSATFNLGIIQALAQLELLPRIDYVSGVSGGGCIASWLCAWILRGGGVSDVQEQLIASVAPWPSGVHIEPPEIWHLRGFSNPLTPQLGLLSDDPTTFLATYVRNLLINLFVVFCAIASMIVLPFLFLAIIHNISSPWRWWLGGILILPPLGTFLANLRLREARNIRPPLGNQAPAWYSTKAWSAGLMFGPIYLTALSIAFESATEKSKTAFDNFSRSNISRLVNQAPSELFVLLFVVGLAIIALFVVARRPVHIASGAHRQTPSWLKTSLRWVGGIAVGSVTLSILWISSARFLWRSKGIVPEEIVFMTFGPGLFIFSCFVALSFFVGFVGRRMTESQREWLAWFGGRNLVSAVAGPLFCISAFYIPWWLSLLPSSYLRYALGAVATAITILGLRSLVSARHRNSRLAGYAGKIAPYAFSLLLISVASWLISLSYSSGPEDLVPYWKHVQDFSMSISIWVWFICIVIALGGAWRVGNNTFSMHHFYRTSLIRCYLESTVPGRRSKAQVGRAEDVPLTRLASNDWDGPFLLLNGSLNLSEGDELAFQERQASSFCFSPLYCGYERRPLDIQEEPISAYQPTERYAYDGGIPLGHAMAISAAALSPNKGLRTSRAAAFLTTILNLRLGWWLPNTRDVATTGGANPQRRRLLYLLYELLGHTHDGSEYVYISDGGHFENTGIYELIRRKCRLVIACDASEDSECTLRSVGNAIEKCRVDFGVEVEIDLSSLRPTQRFCAQGWAWGRIRYTNNSADDGFLLYVKSSLCGEEPIDILSYATAHPEFPHETTVNQWFTESQFECYRRLGNWLGQRAFADLSRCKDSALFGTQLRTTLADLAVRESARAEIVEEAASR